MTKLPFLAVTGKQLTRQILSFVALCLILAEIVIFIPSASHFQYRWFESQWQHFFWCNSISAANQI